MEWKYKQITGWFTKTLEQQLLLNLGELLFVEKSYERIWMKFYGKAQQRTSLIMEVI